MAPAEPIKLLPSKNSTLVIKPVVLAASAETVIGAEQLNDELAAGAVIEDCVVGLPTGLLLRRPMPPTTDARGRLAAAVEAILSVK